MDRDSYLSLGRWAGIGLFLLSTGLLIGLVTFGLPLPSLVTSYAICALAGTLAGVVFGVGMEKRLLKPDMETHAPLFTIGGLYGLMVPIAFASAAVMKSVDPTNAEPISLWLFLSTVLVAMVPFAGLTAWLSLRIRRAFWKDTHAHWRHKALDRLADTLDRLAWSPADKDAVLKKAQRLESPSSIDRLRVSIQYVEQFKP